ncbi:MAG: hypothetical protein LBC87_01915 [Fibromonadaceae bacterium]|jgi:hypothetical protein|nr:hypothetical protein [Fibromonadaceae bacterium]
MTPNVFTALWKNIAEKEIKRTIANQHKIKVKLRENEQVFRANTHVRYQSERCNYRKTIGMDDSDKLGKNEVAASFYIAFVKENNMTCYSNDKKIRDFDSVILRDLDSAINHETAFNIARGILESFILSGNEKIDDGYRKYIEKNGMGFSKGIKKEDVLKLLIKAQNEKKLSIYMLISIFLWLESDTRHCYEATLRG